MSGGTRHQIDCRCGRTTTGETNRHAEILHLTHFLNDHDDFEEGEVEMARDQLEWAKEQADPKFVPGGET